MHAGVTEVMSPLSLDLCPIVIKLEPVLTEPRLRDPLPSLTRNPRTPLGNKRGYRGFNQTRRGVYVHRTGGTRAPAPRVAEGADSTAPFYPAVGSKYLLRGTVKSSRRSGVPQSVCGRRSGGA
ncbi:hypothetical protein EVAR_42502_1 [Eumeta japonica]|uniref:Uncharacterized protein n=1 Tax=Eumeta variegata TaxID=151549 RepID=A0A4C1XJ08_EUMVA|nr:hypothetical protein EVAR_42502_1 [Eumeta japonica]